MGTPSGPKRSWKKSADSAKPDAAGKRSWQHGSDKAAPVVKKGSYRFLVRVLAVILLAGVAGLIAWVFSNVGSTKPLTLIVVSHHDATSLNTPANFYNAQGADALKKWAQDVPQERKLILPPEAQWQKKEQTARDWLDWLITQGKESGEIVVYHFGMPGHADPDGGPYLLMIPGDATHPEISHRLYLKDLFSRLGELDKKQKKVLLFDCTQVDHSLIHGMVTTDFARGLKGLESTIAALSECYVIAASDENQLSWTSPELGMSIFHHYLLQGLQGLAKSTGNRPKISVKNISQYLSTEVEKWSQANRSAVQKPMFLPAAKLDKADEVDMARVPKVIPKEGEAQQRDQLVEIRQDWEKYYQLAQLTPGPDVVAPYLWKSYTALLLRLENMLFGGAETSDVQKVRRRLDSLATTIGELSRSPSWSNSILLQDIYSPDAKTREKDATLASASQLFSAFWKAEGPAALPADVQNWKKLVANTKENPGLRKQLLLHGWRWVMEKMAAEPDVVAAERVLSLIEEELRTSHRPADVHFLRMLVRDTQEQPWAEVRTKKELLRTAMQLRARAERIAWLGNESIASGIASHWVQVSRWIMPALKNADELRRSGEDLLFDAHASQWEKAAGLFAQADQQYAEATSKAQIYVSACQLRDQACYQLPYYGEWVSSTPGPLLEQVIQAWGQTHILARMLQTDQPPDKNIVQGQTATLRKIMTELQGQVQKQVREEVRSATVSTARAFHDLTRLVSMPLFLECYEGPNLAERAKAAREDRGILLRKLKDASYRLFTQSQQASRIADSLPLYRPDDYADARLRLSHARLGDEVIPLIREANVTPVVLNWSVDRRTAPQEQVANLLQVSNKLGIYWSVLPAAMQQCVAAKKAVELLQATGTVESLPEAERWLGLASNLHRLLDPGVAEPVNKHNQLAAIPMERWFQTHRFLLAQAVRSLEENWADLKATDADYSNTVAKLHFDAAQELLVTLAKEMSVEAKDKGWHAYVVQTRGRINSPSGRLNLTINAGAIPRQLPVTDEPYVKFTVGMKPTGVPVPGFPVMRLWSPPASSSTAVSFTLNDKMVNNSPSHFSRALSSTNIPMDEELKWINSQAKLDQATSNEMLPLRAMLLFRGHVYDDASIQVAMLGQPRVRWVREAPDNRQGLVVFGDDRLHDGHIHILFDTTHSMTEPVKGLSISKIDAARKALEEVLYNLPRNVTLSISTFRGIRDQKLIPSTKLIFPPTRWDEPSKYVKQIINSLPTYAVMEKEFNDKDAPVRTITPITRGINETLFQDSQQPLFPIDKNKPFTLLMLTDGVENEAGNSVNVAESIREDMLNCTLKQLNLHILLFSVDPAALKESPEEEKRFREMLEINSEPYRRSFYSKQRTPPQLWPDINSVEALVAKLQDALRPQFTVFQNNEAVKDAINQRVTLPNEAKWNKVPLGANTYDLFTAGLMQKFKLAPGDRMAIRIERQSLNTQLVIPNLADFHQAVPDAHRQTSPNKEVQFALLGQQMQNLPGGGNGLQLQVLMEQPVTRVSREVALSRQRPRFAWFHLEPLGDARSQASQLHLTVNEHVQELASVWTLQSSPWPARTPGGNSLNTPAGYRLDSYWVKENVNPAAGIKLPSLTPGMTEISAIGSVSLPGDGKLQDLMIRQRPGRSGDWLYVRCTHAADKPLLIQLRPSESLPDTTLRRVAEEHRFFSAAQSVSAWFDLASLGQEKELTLDIYSLNEMLEQGEPKTFKLIYETNDSGAQVIRLKSRSWNRD